MPTEKILIIIVAGIIAIVWLVFHIYGGIINGRNAVSEEAATAGFYYDVKCEICRMQRQASYLEVTEDWIRKQKSISGNANIGGIAAGGTHYLSFLKKLFCSHCQKKTWHQILNHTGHDYQALTNTRIAIVPVLKGLLIGLLGILIVGMFIWRLVLM